MNRLQYHREWSLWMKNDLCRHQVPWFMFLTLHASQPRKSLVGNTPLAVFPLHLVAIHTNAKFTLRIHSVQTEDGGITHITHFLNPFDSSLLATLQETLLLYGCTVDMVSFSEIAIWYSCLQHWPGCTFLYPHQSLTFSVTGTHKLITSLLLETFWQRQGSINLVRKFSRICEEETCNHTALFSLSSLTLEKHCLGY